MRIATWNVNSVNARLETVLGWFEQASPDVACLQEIKCVDEKFPAEAFERLGYNIAVHGQKAYNGVAILSKTPLEDIRKGLPQESAYDVVYRHALSAQGGRVAFGSTTGNLFISEDRGETFVPVAHHLPPIYSVRFG